MDGGAPVQVINAWSVSPAVSPNGKWLAFIYWQDEFPGQRVAIAPTNAHAPPKVFDFDADFVRWTPDSRSLLYNRRERDVDNIWRQPIDGGAPQQVTDFKAGLIWNFDWSRDGEQLVCARGYEQSDVALIRHIK